MEGDFYVAVNGDVYEVDRGRLRYVGNNVNCQTDTSRHEPGSAPYDGMTWAEGAKSDGNDAQD